MAIRWQVVNQLIEERKFGHDVAYIAKWEQEELLWHASHGYACNFECYLETKGLEEYTGPWCGWCCAAITDIWSCATPDAFDPEITDRQLISDAEDDDTFNKELMEIADYILKNTVVDEDTYTIAEIAKYCERLGIWKERKKMYTRYDKRRDDCAK